MEFQITMDPFMDFIFRMFIIGANIVVWTIIAMWLQTEIKSWFPKDEEDDEPVTHNPQFDPTTVNVYNNMAAYSAKDAELTQQLFDLGLPPIRKKATEADYELLSSVNVTPEQVQAVADKIESNRLPEKKPTEADAGIVIRQGLGRPSDLLSLDEIAAYSPPEETDTSAKPSYIVQWSKYGSFMKEVDQLHAELTTDISAAVRRLVTEFGDGYIRRQLTTDGQYTWVEHDFVTKEMLEMPNYANQHTMENKNA